MEMQQKSLYVFFYTRIHTSEFKNHLARAKNQKTRITLDLHSPSQKIQPVRRSSDVISIRINPYNDRNLRVDPCTRILRFTKDTCSLFILVVQSGTIFSSPISIFFSNRQPVARRRTIFCCLDYGDRLFRANQFSQ